MISTYSSLNQSVDGVLVRSSDPIPRAHEALAFLQRSRIPFILLTNGGGKHESERVTDLSKKLNVPLDTSMFIQSHTPFADISQYKNVPILVIGGDHDKCRSVAHAYGFQHVVLPADILTAHPSIWPFSSTFTSHYARFAQPLPAPIDPAHPDHSLRIGAIFVYNDPRDWGLDASLILDLLLSRDGILGTKSAKNGDRRLPNRGFQQDGQPPVYFSNPDLWWAAQYHLPRLGQGGFREALEGVWAAVTGGPREGVELRKEVFGKPFQMTYEFAERRLVQHRKELFREREVPGLRKVYMVGDNPESDIRGGNMYRSPLGSEWESVLVRTGVYEGEEEPAWKPDAIVKDVWDAVQWGLEKSGWRERLE